MLLILMLTASGLALALRPTQKIAGDGFAIDLERMVPHAFGDWREEQQNLLQIVDPQQKEVIDRIYTQTLSRTYVHRDGYRIMLAIAYGEDQRDAMQVHYPEVCYPGQGFALQERQTGTLTTKTASIPVTRLLTTLGPRSEPVTYWITVGDHIVQGRVQKKLAEMRYGLAGRISDGMLIRISSIDGEVTRAYERQAQFTDQLLGALEPQYRNKLNGNHGKN